MPNCYYYDEQRNHCKCYVNENLNELLAENAKLLKLLQRTWDAFHDSTAREFVTVKNELRELGIEVDE